MSKLSIKAPVGNFSRGFFTPFRSFRLVKQHPRLALYMVIPFLINLLVFSGVVYLGLDVFGNLVVGQLPSGDAWYWAVLYWLLWGVAFVVTAVLVFFTFTVVGNLIASPFNDLLSERTEEILRDRLNSEPFVLKQFLSDAWQTLLLEAKKMLVFVVVMLAILPLNLVPLAGNSLYTICAISLTLFFLCIEYLSFTMVRQRQYFKEQYQFIISHKLLMLGFGLGVMAILAIPFLQLLCIPLAVIGATRLWCEEEGLAKPSLASEQAVPE
ncbi:MAG: EI24 domain-containing protein [Deltaproteobacteria bacterium]|nr:EI24 domain-containing protein [Deltaproteobacteria bacterium]MBW2504593.1 EI24 domain-containing protein [Deltaproteobacteria bacterium]MBW2519653.1 EI24 domain-containing protein [Deltaproteobacteria bacterium]